MESGIERCNPRHDARHLIQPTRQLDFEEANDEAKKAVHKAFVRIDRDQSNSIDLKEFRKFVESCGKIDELLDDIDKENAQANNADGTDDDLARESEAQASTGSINEDELREIFLAYGAKEDPKNPKELILTEVDLVKTLEHKTAQKRKQWDCVRFHCVSVSVSVSVA